ncbi:unnamed protein product [Cyprideis torosa]|uniref:Uncharacterized protein n=1 Tax=Cyprideis torosa TaxID=163714 RepID=A0A7R8ZQ84_9CRUS|nr:unnamed protein product [Cyprideis torosa]CAG0890078.1 unnamed protein product [Cyprideis torosa]
MALSPEPDHKNLTPALLQTAPPFGHQREEKGLARGEDVPPTLSSEVEIARGYSEDDVDSPWLPLISDHEQEPSDIPEENDDSISETKIPTSIWKGVGEEVPKHYKKPRVKSYHKMIKLLGGEENLEPEFMSVEKPKDVVEKKDEAETQASFTSQERLLLTALKDLRLARKLRSLASDLVQRDASQTEVIELTKAWLEDELTCKITKNWKDLGQFFWPRWIYQGHCDTSSSTCTAPALNEMSTKDFISDTSSLARCRLFPEKPESNGGGEKLEITNPPQFHPAMASAVCEGHGRECFPDDDSNSSEHPLPMEVKWPEYDHPCSSTFSECYSESVWANSSAGLCTASAALRPGGAPTNPPGSRIHRSAGLVKNATVDGAKTTWWILVLCTNLSEDAISDQQTSIPSSSLACRIFRQGCAQDQLLSDRGGAPTNPPGSRIHRSAGLVKNATVDGAKTTWWILVLCTNLSEDANKSSRRMKNHHLRLEQSNIFRSRNPFAPENRIPLPFAPTAREPTRSSACGRLSGNIPVSRRNERERQRVRCVNNAFLKLRRLLPNEHVSKRMSKLDILRTAINYIEDLRHLLEFTVEEHSTLLDDDEENSSTESDSVTNSAQWFLFRFRHMAELTRAEGQVPRHAKGQVQNGDSSQSGDEIGSELVSNRRRQGLFQGKHQTLSLRKRTAMAIRIHGENSSNVTSFTANGRPRTPAPMKDMKMLATILMGLVVVAPGEPPVEAPILDHRERRDW